jgi:hypothetical protein
MDPIVKYTATHSSGATSDFLSLEDLIAHDGAATAPVDAATSDSPSVEAPVEAAPAELVAETVEAPAEESAEAPAAEATEVA